MTDCRVCGAKCPGWFMCAPCGHELERAIAEMPSLMAELSNVATGQTRVYRASGGVQPNAELHYDPEAHIPAYLRSRDGRTALRPTRLMVRLDIRELLWICGNTLSSWARHLSETRGIVGPTADNLVPWLVEHVNAIRLDEAAAECHDEVTTIHRQAERAVDRSPSRLFAGPCGAPLLDGSKCERDLYRKPSADDITCDGWRGDGEGCGAGHDVDERRSWLAAEVESALVTLEEILSALSWLYPELQRPPSAVVGSWVRKGKIVAHGLSPVGEPTYVGGEVVALVRAYKPHQFAPRRKRRAA